MSLNKNTAGAIDLSPEIQDKYSLFNETFFQVAKFDPHDFIDVEIGDSKQPDFYPQIKVKRWDNDVNFSARLVHNEIEPVIATDSNKIIWQGKKIDVNLYDLPESEELPEGGYEFEVILKEKPATNVIEFSLNTKGLDFFYQPIYSDQEIKKEKKNGNYIFKEFMGSYAIYTSDKKINYINGKLYKTGKVGQIMRPRIIDAEGNETWGTLNIDLEKSLLKVTIPQDFLNKAIYPVRHAAGMTFGYTSTPTSGAVTVSVYGPYFQLFANTYAGSVYRMSAWMVGLNLPHSGYTPTGKAAIYSAAKAYIAGSDELTLPNNTTKTLNSFTISATVAASTSYYLAIAALNHDGTYGYNLYYDTTTGTDTGRDETAYASLWPDPASFDATSTTRNYGIFAYYFPTAGGTYTETFSTPGTWKWRCPTGVTSINVACWGAGGCGINYSVDSGGGGGGGGAYAASNNIAVTAGNDYAVVVGAANTTANTAGGESSFNSTTVVAKGGVGGYGAVGGAGGQASASTGDTKYNGGGGGDGLGANDTGAGGGGAGGPHGAGAKGADGNASTGYGGNGGNGDNGSGGAGGNGGNGAAGSAGAANTNGGGGGGGGDDGYTGGVGGAYGGGGGGGNLASGNLIGGNGCVTITYTISSSTTYAKTVQAKARIEQSNISKAVTAKADIKNISIAKTVTAKTRIEKSNQAYTIQAKARVEASRVSTIQARARMKLLSEARTVISKARVEQVNIIKTTAAKGRVKQTGKIKSIQAKAAIEGGNTETLQAKARVEQANISKTATAKANILSAKTQTAQSKARVRRLNVLSASATKAYIVSVGKVELYSPEDESTQEIPLYFEWIIPSNRWGVNINFHLQIDKTDNSFADLELEKKSWQDSGFEYYNGDSWEAFPITGVPPSYVGRHCRYQAATLIDGTKYWRVKAYAG